MSTLEEFFVFLKEVEENPGQVSESIVFNHVKEHIGELSNKEVGRIIGNMIVRSDLRVLLIKARCDAGNTLACEELKLVVDGDPLSKQESKQLGLMGLWTVKDNEAAGELLVDLGVIPLEDLDAKRKPDEGIEERSTEQQFADLVDEVKKYTSSGLFMSAVFADALKSVKSPTMSSIYTLIEGKYASIEDFYNAVQKGEPTPTPPPEPPIPSEAPPTPPLEKESLEDLEAMKKAIEARMSKLKQEKQTPKEPTLIVKEEILIPPSNITISYMEPSDYEKWGFFDFESIIPGLKFEDLQQLSSHVGLSERMTGQEKDTIRQLITNRMNEIRVSGL